MKTLVAGLILFSIPAFRPTPSPRKPAETTVVAKTHRGGRWYLAANGHAVYCRGPVITINMTDGLRKVATYCQGEKPLVPLKE
jgi:hypothetical protein